MMEAGLLATVEAPLEQRNELITKDEERFKNFETINGGEKLFLARITFAPYFSLSLPCAPYFITQQQHLTVQIENNFYT